MELKLLTISTTLDVLHQCAKQNYFCVFATDLLHSLTFIWASRRISWRFKTNSTVTFREDESEAPESTWMCFHYILEL